MTDRPGPGLGLIELMLTLTVAALLASVAYPSYLSQLAKGRRGDGKRALLELAQQLERFHTVRGTYAGAMLGRGGLYPALSPGGYYAISISSQTADGFVIAAAPTNSQTGDACGVLGYNQLGDRTVGTPATLRLEQCW